MFIKNLIRSLTNRYLIGGQYDERIKIFFKSVLDNIIKQINSKKLKLEPTELMKEFNIKAPSNIEYINPETTKDMKLPGIYLISQDYQHDKDIPTTLKIGIGKDVLGRIDEYGTLAYDGVFLYGIGFDISNETLKEKEIRSHTYEKYFHKVFKNTKTSIKSNTYTRLLNNIPGQHFGEWFNFSINDFIHEITISKIYDKMSYVFIIFDKPIRFANFIVKENKYYPATIYYNGYQLTRETLTL
jgi:hypothetical protein